MTAASTLPHWICPSCRAFNGAGKRVHYICRVCGASKPANGAPETYDVGALVRVLRDLAEENVVLNERLTELQARESRYVLTRQRGELRPCAHDAVQNHELYSREVFQWCERCGAIRFSIEKLHGWTDWVPIVP